MLCSCGHLKRGQKAPRGMVGGTSRPRLTGSALLVLTTLRFLVRIVAVYKSMAPHNLGLMSIMRAQGGVGACAHDSPTAAADIFQPIAENRHH